MQVASVSEAAALKAGGVELIVTKQKSRQRHPGGGPGRLAVVSLGPGFADYLIPRAKNALAEAQVVVGYQTYIDLVRPWLTTQEVVATGMKAEVKRCQLALDRACAGQKVALVSSGDAGIYGMAGLVLEMCAVQGLKVGPPEAACGRGPLPGGDPRGPGPGRGGGALGGAVDARFCRHLPERPPHPLGDYS